MAITDTMKTRLALNPQRYSSFCFISAGIKDVLNHAW
ncbi:mCG148196 [Mus musculus]|nr:mCG148196 [Mus musculus]